MEPLPTIFLFVDASNPVETGLINSDKVAKIPTQMENCQINLVDLVCLASTKERL